MTTDRPLKPGDRVHIEAEACERIEGVTVLILANTDTRPAHEQWLTAVDPEMVRWQHAPEPDGEDGTAAEARRLMLDRWRERDEARAKVAALEAELMRMDAHALSAIKAEASAVRELEAEVDRLKAAAANGAGAEVREMNGTLLAKVATLQGEVDRLYPVVEALGELVNLHDGPRDDDYERRKPRAWEVARAALAAYAHRAAQKVPTDTYRPARTGDTPGELTPGEDDVTAEPHAQKAPTDGPAATESHQQVADGKTDAEAPEGAQGAVCGFDGRARCPEGTPGCGELPGCEPEPVPKREPMDAQDVARTLLDALADARHWRSEARLNLETANQETARVDRLRRKLKRAREALANIADVLTSAGALVERHDEIAGIALDMISEARGDREALRTGLGQLLTEVICAQGIVAELSDGSNRVGEQQRAYALLTRICDRIRSVREALGDGA